MKRFLLDYLSTRRLQGELTVALRARDFVLYVQPEVDLVSGRIVAAEALIRWNHLERGLLPPSEFVPFAQEHGLLPSIDAWVVGEAAAAAAALRAIDPSFRLWFNVSAGELGDPRWLASIANFGDTLQGLGAEITENVAMSDVRETVRTLTRLKNAGLSIALDDFGTGYSSLAQLQRLPVDVVKLDRTFTAGLPGDGRDREIVNAILSIGAKFGFETVAEGIETAEQAHALRESGCRYGQGYYLGRPMPVHELLTLLNESEPVAS